MLHFLQKELCKSSFKTCRRKVKRQIALIQVWRALLPIFRDWVPKKRSACDWDLKQGFLKCLLKDAEWTPQESSENVPRKGTCPAEAEVPGEHTMLSVLEHGSEFKTAQQRRAEKLPLTSALSLQELAQITLLEEGATGDCLSKVTLAEMVCHVVCVKTRGKGATICRKGHSPSFGKQQV